MDKATVPRIYSQDNILPHDGEAYTLPKFYATMAADDIYQTLLHEVNWQTERLFIYGGWHQVPRLIAWYGDPGATYRYSRQLHQPLPWITCLEELRDDLQHNFGVRFNSVLANLYRDGNDSMGCHADDEPELGQEPNIASLSFGATRTFRFKHKNSTENIDLELGHGDLLWMRGKTQQCWMHELPKRRRVLNARINLTFRLVERVV